MLRTFAFEHSDRAFDALKYFHWPTDRRFSVIDMLPIETRRAAGSDRNPGSKTMTNFTKLKTALTASVTTLASVASLYRNMRENLAEVVDTTRLAWHRQPRRPANWGILLADGLRRRDLPFYMVDPVSWRRKLDRRISQPFELDTGLVPAVVQVPQERLDLLATPLPEDLLEWFAEKKSVFVEPNRGPDGIGINAVLNLLVKDGAVALLYEDARLIIDDFNSELDFVTYGGMGWKTEFEVRLEKVGIADSFYRIAEFVVSRKRHVILVLVDLPLFPKLWSFDPGKALLPRLQPLKR